MLDISRADLVAGVVGAGTMGRGIAQVLAQCGVRTLVYDAQPGAAQKARDAISQMLARLAERGKLEPAAMQAALGRIELAESLDAFAPCHVVVEAIVEDLEAKRALFTRLERVVGADCILASNTSSLSVTAMAAACKRPQRVAGYHFFNPVPLMKIVEVVDGVLTERWATDALAALAKRFGHTPVRCKDTPGFVVNHAGRAFVPEALRILSEGVADFATIDRILVDAAGFRMGPFTLMDLVGLDVSHAVMKSMYHQYYEEPKYRPSFLAEPRVAAGLFGRKSGRGWYEYGKDGAAHAPAEPAAPKSLPDSVWAAPELKDLFTTLKARIVARPEAKTVCFVAPIGKDATTSALEHGLDPARTVAVDPLFGFAKRRTLMTTPATQPEAREAAHALLASDGKPVSVINDSPGFVAQRVVAHIVNVGCDIAQMRIAAPEDLDRAVMLGLGYPRGPLAMGDAVGAARILAVLEAMHDFYQEPRYRPSPWLKRRARLGVSLLTPE
ncbi:MAG: 3-hydroxyacyl-CoA dehydrogenase [Betaproteobacteria bacterium]|nr:MAG: 3-hydroxyacyl-CoA dehydrogenase [Betaproteobacteria bacterium]